jgi:hypothetical protein
MTILYIVIEWFCILGFFVAGIRCLYGAYADFNNGSLVGFLWLFLGGVLLVVVSVGGTVQFFKKVRNRK